MPLLLSGLRLVLRKVMGQLRTAQCARTYSFQSRILPTGYKVNLFEITSVFTGLNWRRSRSLLCPLKRPEQLMGPVTGRERSTAGR